MVRDTDTALSEQNPYFNMHTHTRVKGNLVHQLMFPEAVSGESAGKRMSLETKHGFSDHVPARKGEQDCSCPPWG
jgi:hypothetical protein